MNKTVIVITHVTMNNSEGPSTGMNFPQEWIVSIHKKAKVNTDIQMKGTICQIGKI